MLTTARELDQLVDVAANLAREAGDITLNYFRRLTSAAVSRKRDGSFVTTADREAEAFLRRAIQREFPDDAILGEEEGETKGKSNRRWIVDPIDGTYSFVHGVPFYAVLIGVEIDGEPTVGVINAPATGDLVAGARGRGCRWNDGAARVSEVATLGESLLLSTDFGACERYGFGEAVRRLERGAAQRRTWGDAYGHLLVATGRAEIMLDPVMNVW
ncbi:MAG TPA: inositol monophosphatase family protein, partial [Pyrinomonadaceae bacterium]|nr:inositol monophosphatase family protein [Pyrinomonadaceae bacterium]